MPQITYDTVVPTLLHAIPELSDKYAELMSRWGAEQPGPHVVYDLYVDYLVELSSRMSDPTVEQAMIRAMNLLERLASSNDHNVRCLVDTGLLEDFVDMADLLGNICRYMGPVTAVCLRRHCEKLGLDAEFLRKMGIP